MAKASKSDLPALAEHLDRYPSGSVTLRRVGGRWVAALQYGEARMETVARHSPQTALLDLEDSTAEVA